MNRGIFLASGLLFVSACSASLDPQQEFTQDRMMLDQMVDRAEPFWEQIAPDRIIEVEKDRAQEFQRVKTEFGEDSLEAADFLMAVGTGYLHYSPNIGDAVSAPIAADVIAESVSYYEAHFGAIHPEVALAKHTLSDVLEIIERGDQQARYERIISLMEEASSIREQSLGANHPETIYSNIRLASLRLLHGRDPSAAAALYRAQLPSLPRGETFRPGDVNRTQAHYALVELLVERGLFDEAMDELAIAAKSPLPRTIFRTCTYTRFKRTKVANLLRDAGRERDAQTVMKRMHTSRCGIGLPLEENWV